LWQAGEKLLQQLQDVLHWNVLTGEVCLLTDFEEDVRTPIANSNIVDILHHALDAGSLEPVGYAQVYPFLPPGHTKPDKVPDVKTDTVRVAAADAKGKKVKKSSKTSPDMKQKPKSSKRSQNIKKRFISVNNKKRKQKKMKLSWYVLE